jgi:hypothetical protein
MKITDGLCCVVSDNDGYDAVQYGVMYGHRVVRNGGGMVWWYYGWS